MTLRQRLAAAVHLLMLALAPPLCAQAAPSGAVMVTVRSNEGPLEQAEVRAGGATATTDAEGRARLELAAGRQTLNVVKVGFRPASAVVTVVAERETPVRILLRAAAVELEEMTVSATRAERRLSETAIRVEVVEPDEVEDATQMSPGGVAHLLSETSGLRMQVTSPSLGGANVRIQGLRGRYTQILSDGLPLYGGIGDNLTVQQVPPVDLQRVEVIKGVASALYGAQALGGVINLVSRPPVSARELLLNQTNRGATDAVGWVAGAIGGGWSTSLLGGAHRQARKDLDGDGWSDMAGYRRGVIRPRLFWADQAGSSLLVTAGGMVEEREGGTLPPATAPDGRAFPEDLDTRRFDVGAIGRRSLGEGRFLSLRGSAMQQRHRHLFGETLERDRYRTGFGELSLTLRQGSRTTWVMGAAMQGDGYRAQDVPRFDYTYTVRALFAQYDRDLADWASVSASARLDDHSRFGTYVSPRLSLLLRPGGVWNVRLSAGTAIAAPTPFVEETEVIGLSRLATLGPLAAQRARGVSADVSGEAGPLEVNLTVFGSVLDHSVQLRELPVAVGGFELELANAVGPTRTYGGEALVRWRPGPFVVTANYGYLHATETGPETGLRREVALNPRHSAGLVATLEEEAGRIGFEAYYVGRQSLEDDPYRSVSRPYVHLGLLVTRRFGNVQLFMNGENLLNVRQTWYDSLVRPAPDAGGRWTTEAWAPLDGRVVNVGTQIRF
jgi:outer membrane receptor for ferrienterochelin and colicins